MKKYFFRINWSLIREGIRVEKGVLNYTSTIRENAHYDIRDHIKHVNSFRPDSCVSIDHIKRVSIKRRSMYCFPFFPNVPF
jgi:hypothetical protein